MYILAFYEIDLGYGGPEEGGWWFNTGSLARPLRLCRNEEQAYKLARRANRLLDFLQRKKIQVSSAAYRGGIHEVLVFENELPKGYPERRPRYE